MTSPGPRYALAPTSPALRGVVCGADAVPQFAVPGPPVRSDARGWIPSTPARGPARRPSAARVAVTAAFALVVLAVPTAATSIAAVLLDPSVVTTQRVPGGPPAPPPVPPMCCMSAR